MSNLPLGAEYKYNAPFNRKEVSITVSTDIGNYTVVANEDEWEEMSHNEQVMYLKQSIKHQLNEVQLFDIVWYGYSN